MKNCAKYEERIALYAAGEDDEEAAIHAARCPRCAEELASVRALLGKVRETRPPAPPTDERFWQDFGRGVRLAHGEAARRPSWFWVWSLAAAGAALALFVWVRGALPGADQDLPAPAIAHVKPVALPTGSELGDLDERELTLVLDSLDPAETEEESGTDTDEDLALASADDLERVLDDLDTPALGALAETL
jgi:hypothetical protein